MFAKAPSDGSGIFTVAVFDRSTIWRWLDFLACLATVAPSWLVTPPYHTEGEGAALNSLNQLNLEHPPLYPCGAQPPRDG